MKRFITIVIFTFILLFSVSSFASIDAGLILKSWCKQKFDYQAEEMAGDFLKGSQEIRGNIELQKNDEMNGAANILQNFTSELLEESGGAIGKYQQQYIKVANETVRDLEEINFSSVKSEEVIKLNKDLDYEAVEILKEILQ